MTKRIREVFSYFVHFGKPGAENSDSGTPILRRAAATSQPVAGIVGKSSFINSLEFTPDCSDYA
jgi:hypothetical protein